MTHGKQQLSQVLQNQGKENIKNWANVSNRVKSWLMDWLGVTEWHPVNNDIIPNDCHE